MFAEKERLSISKYVSQHREVLPAICIMTPQNRNRSIWTEQGPELVVVQRMKKLAQISLEWFKRILLSGEKDPPLEVSSFILFIFILFHFIRVILKLILIVALNVAFNKAFQTTSRIRIKIWFILNKKKKSLATFQQYS